GKSDHAPRDHVAIAAIDRIAEETLDRALPQMLKKNITRHAAEVLASGLKTSEIRVLLLRVHGSEGCPGLRQLLVDRIDRCSKQFRGRERQLVALARRTGLPRSTSIETFADPPRASELLVDVVGNAGCMRAWPLIVFRDEPCHGRFNERCFLAVQKQVSCEFGSGA